MAGISESGKVCPLCGQAMERVSELVPEMAGAILIPKEHWRCLCGHTEALYTVRDEA